MSAVDGSRGPSRRPGGQGMGRLGGGGRPLRHPCRRAEKVHVSTFTSTTCTFISLSAPTTSPSTTTYSTSGVAGRAKAPTDQLIAPGAADVDYAASKR